VIATPTCNVGNCASTTVDVARDFGGFATERALPSGLKLKTSSPFAGGLDGVRRPPRGGLLLPAPGRELERDEALRGCATFLLVAVGTVCTAGLPRHFAGFAGAGADACLSGVVGVTISGETCRATGTANAVVLGAGGEDLGDPRLLAGRARAGDDLATVPGCCFRSAGATVELNAVSPEMG